MLDLIQHLLSGASQETLIPNQVRIKLVARGSKLAAILHTPSSPLPEGRRSYTSCCTKEIG
jgi:hypothetical protein